MQFRELSRISGIYAILGNPRNPTPSSACQICGQQSSFATVYWPAIVQPDVGWAAANGDSTHWCIAVPLFNSQELDKSHGPKTFFSWSLARVQQIEPHLRLAILEVSTWNNLYTQLRLAILEVSTLNNLYTQLRLAILEVSTLNNLYTQRVLN